LRLASAVVLSGLALSVLAGCADQAAYQPIGGETKSSFGYKETRTGDGLYSLLVVVPAQGGPTLAYQYWDRRAAELCGNINYKKNIFRAERPTQMYDYYGGRPGEFVLEGFLDCHPELTKTSSTPAH
jgi:hypothetical protein